MRPAIVQRKLTMSGPCVQAAIAAVDGRADVAVLDSADTAPGRGRYTILACEPLEVMAAWPGDADPFETLRSRLERLRPERTSRFSAASPPLPLSPAAIPARALPPGDSAAGAPFTGGWIGYFSYEAGHHVEHMPGRPRADIRLPVARWGLYDSAAIHDAVTGEWSIVAADLRPYHRAAVAPGERIAFWADLLAAAVPPQIGPAPPVRGVVENLSQTEYLSCVRRAKEYIAAGDIFQVNLARRISVEHREAPMQTYLRLRRQNPAAYAAYLAWDGGASAILSASPELFLDLRGSEVMTRPIKGTRPRSTDPVLDASYREALLASEKDRAELAMIVDLERNDLGRVCEYGTIRVSDSSHSASQNSVAAAPRGGRAPARRRCHTGLGTHSDDPLSRRWENGAQCGAGECAIFQTAAQRSGNRKSEISGQPSATGPWFTALESHPTVHHLVATIRGRLRRECDAIDLLRATFPGGSITGAPKVRAMQIIDELEPTRRSVYTGAIGYLSLDGRMQLNIAIRTILIADGQAHIHVGSGIVADSDPHEEYVETAAKAAGLCRAAGIDQTAAESISR